MTLRLPLSLCGALLALGLSAAETQGASDVTAQRLQTLLQRFPEADANRDGVLTEQEARAYADQRRGGGGGSGTSSAPTQPGSAPSAAAAVRGAVPTRADVRYGPHERNVLDFWAAKSDGPTPVVVYIHGGGFVSGDKGRIRTDRIIQQCLDAGVSFAAINYRYLSGASPLPDVLRDCARAIQFIRAQAEAWNVDKTKLAAYGSSAGAGTSLWLAFHDDLADPQSPDPVLRESTRLVCAGSMQGQFSYDFLLWTDVFGEDAVRRFGGRYMAPELIGLKTREEMESPAGRKLRADCDMLGLISKDDPPVFISASQPDLALENSSQFLHHPKHSQLLYERCREVGVPVVAQIPALKITPSPGAHATWREFVLYHLK
jgi:acetyl esterase